jgi:hypothetical protein
MRISEDLSSSTDSSLSKGHRSWKPSMAVSSINSVACSSKWIRWAFLSALSWLQAYPLLTRGRGGLPKVLWVRSVKEDEGVDVYANRLRWKRGGGRRSEQRTKPLLVGYKDVSLLFLVSV